MQEHPGGSSIILKYAGKDATAVYEPIHPPDALNKNLSQQQHLGELDTSAAEEVAREAASRAKTKDELRVERAQREKPPLSRILDLEQMEVRKFINLLFELFSWRNKLESSKRRPLIQSPRVLLLCVR